MAIHAHDIVSIAGGAPGVALSAALLSAP